MNSTNIDNSDNLTSAEDYYKAMVAKNFTKMASYLHHDVHFISPLSEMRGKSMVVLAAKKLSDMLESINIRGKFAADNQIMFAYDFMFNNGVGILRAALLMSFNDKLISKIELFYDSKPFIEKKKEIFSE